MSKLMLALLFITVVGCSSSGEGMYKDTENDGYCKAKGYIGYTFVGFMGNGNGVCYFYERDGTRIDVTLKHLKYLEKKEAVNDTE